jgi:hypothetical protein
MRDFLQDILLQRDHLQEIRTIFTLMQDDSILRQPPPPPIKNHVCLGKMYLSTFKMTPPQNKTSAKKKYFAINFIHVIHKACEILFTLTNQCQCLHLHSQCLLFSPNIPTLFTVIPQHIIISPILFALDLSQSLLARCATMPLWSTLTKYYIYISWLNLLELM